tara:strand:+ start:2365 stop:2868 length:504 start_codon:yes stop_codon:yes gene_type:complete
MTNNHIKKYNSSFLPSKMVHHFDRNEFLTPFDKLFDDLFTSSFPDISKELGVGFFEKQSFPKVDIIDYDTEIEIEAEIPGLTKEDVDVSVNENILTISGNSVTDSKSKPKLKYIRKELKHSSFKRSFTLSENIDINRLKAKFENGLLKIRLPKFEPVKPKVKKIKIE